MYRLKWVAATLTPLLFGAPVGVVFASDTGDAPESFGLATHEVVIDSPRLGERAGDDNAPVSGPDALGDDSESGADGTVQDDEDGVFGHPQLVQNGKAYDTNVFVYNPSPVAATVVGWVDFDGDGQFATDEASFATVPPGANNLKVKLLWPDTTSLTSDYFGPAYLRIRITTDTITAGDSTGGFSDGEVEDYRLDILADTDGDEIADRDDDDNDNDGIPDSIEQVGVDTDNDGTPNYLDVDSDNDFIPDFIEAGSNALLPIDTDGDGQPDYLDLDSNNDGIPDRDGMPGDADRDGISDELEGTGDSDQDGILNSSDLDSDNDTIPDAIERGNNPLVPVDSDGDLVADFLDIDSDNDGIPDIREGNSGEINIDDIDSNNDGRVDGGLLIGVNGLVDSIETQIDSGIPIFAVPDSDADSIRDFRDLDSDNDGEADVTEAGGADSDANQLVDGYSDADADGVPDQIDVDLTGGADTDFDSVDDIADADFVNAPDADQDGIIDQFDIDANGDGLIDGTSNSLFTNGELPDSDGDFIPDYRDDTDDASNNGSDNTTGDTAGDASGGGTSGNTNGNAAIGQIETGLSGAAGCSLGLSSAARDPFLPGVALLSLIMAAYRRRYNLSRQGA